MSATLVWFLVGVAFLVAELMVPGFILLFFAMGSWFTAVVLLFFPELPVQWQIAGFVAASLAFLFSLRRVAMRTFSGTQSPEAGEEADPMVGRNAIVTKPILPGQPGEVKCMGSYWRAESTVPLDAGTAVRVAARPTADGLTLEVYPLIPEANES
ncbi:NfeD family protein [Oceanidesulfovibrio indonesiensis]|uniref:NfeD family protein n=1 Tax=Oceanidesulfovibrio indonesiensis TaxID=54767 RepID=A0A7M3MDT6_9BACT|nr:NfeD family protein [Oceanidesulfovibrio indonesiensis]TVM16879.1 NfeD family protein [Oceanidesulfovibrio indonesiensis]